MDQEDNNLDQTQDTTEDQTSAETEPEVSVDSLINKIIDNDNVNAEQDFESIIAAKLQNALDAKKQEIAYSLYNNSEDGSEQEAEEQEV